MEEVRFSSHAWDMLQERHIPEAWARQAMQAPDRTAVGHDHNMHYIKAIAEHGGRFLRVVVNPHVTPKRIVTVFFGRRLRRES
jgi:uncharacterized protein DUF4258